MLLDLKIGLRKNNEIKIEIKEQACDSKFKSHETHCSLPSVSHDSSGGREAYKNSMATF